jgi:F1F0 ATPase subunit 2
MFFLSKLLIPFVLGGLIGWIYFAGLWKTVKRLPETRSPHGLMIFSFAARTLFALGGFFILADGQWERMTATLLGFFLVRAILVRTLGRTPHPSPTGAYLWKS